jgi:hypothetical protein
MNLLLRTIAVLFATTASAVAQDAAFTTGLATTTNPGLVDCGGGSRISAVGEIADDAGTRWVVPAATQLGSAPAAADLFNPCGGVQLSGLSALDVSSVPVMDAGGTEEFTAYIFADNYFELSVNGVLIAVDPVPFTPFNSNVVRFRAERPVTLAVMGVDWEEHLGLGSERNRGKAYHPGDAGFVMQLRDASGAIVVITDETWKAQTFYTAPLDRRGCRLYLVIEPRAGQPRALAKDRILKPRPLLPPTAPFAHSDGSVTAVASMWTSSSPGSASQTWRKSSSSSSVSSCCGSMPRPVSGITE